MRQHAVLMEGNGGWHKPPSQVPFSYAIVPVLKPLTSSMLRRPCLALEYYTLPFKYCVYVLSHALRKLLPCFSWLGGHLTHNYQPGNWLLSKSNSFPWSHYTACPPSFIPQHGVPSPELIFPRMTLKSTCSSPALVQASIASLCQLPHL